MQEPQALTTCDWRLDNDLVNNRLVNKSLLKVLADRLPLPVCLHGSF